MAPSILGLASAILGIPTITTFIQNLISALTRNSEYIENVQCTRNQLQEFEDEDLLGKMSILLTPTGYSDGSLNTVIPPYQLLSELVTNGSFDTDSDWTKGTGWTISGGKAIATSAPSGSQLYQSSLTVGKKYRATFTITDITSGAFRFLFGDGGNASGNYTSAGTYTIDFTAAGSSRLGIRTVFTTSGSVDNISVKEIQEADFDFSRGSSATRVNEQGLVEDVQILSGELVQNGNFEQIGAEEVTNGNFETDTDWIKGTGWSISDGKAIATSTNGSLYQANDFVSGKSYKITFQITSYESGGLICRFNNDETNIFNLVGTHTLYFKSDNSFDYVYFLGDNSFTGSIDNISVKEVGQNWTFGTGWSMGDEIVESNNTSSFISQSGLIEPSKLYRLTFQARLKSGTNGTINAYIGGSNNQQFTIANTDWQSFTYEDTRGSSTANSIYFNNNGTELELDNVSVVEVTNDTDLPRIDYSPYSGAGTCGHILLEPQRTNLLLHSEDFSTWNVLNNAVVTDNFTTSPDGSQNASKFTFDGTTNGRIEKPVTTTIGNEYTFSVWLKNDNLADPTQVWMGNSQFVQGEYVTITNEWQRFTTTQTADGTTEYPRINVNQVGSIFAWGAQFEEGNYATSYIPTSGSTVTRSADVANNSGNADLFNDSEGVLYAEIAALANDGTFRSISISSDAGYNNSIMIRYVSTSNQINVITRIGSATNNTSVDVNDITEFNKIAFKYKSENCVLFINGVQVATSSQAFNSSGINNLSFDRGGGAADFYGKTKAVAVFKEALSNDELELLTGEGYNSFAALAAAYNYNVI